MMLCADTFFPWRLLLLPNSYEGDSFLKKVDDATHSRAPNHLRLPMAATLQEGLRRRLWKAVCRRRLPLANVGLLAKRFICHKCRSKAYIIHDEKRPLVVRYWSVVFCAQSPGCGAAIPLLRLEANPQAVFCIRCQTDMEDVPEGPQFPETPIDKKSCPSCLKKIGKSIPTVVYQNRSDGTFFLGCSRYPKCHWSYDPVRPWSLFYINKFPLTDHRVRLPGTTVIGIRNFPTNLLVRNETKGPGPLPSVAAPRTKMEMLGSFSINSSKTFPAIPFPQEEDRNTAGQLIKPVLRAAATKPRQRPDPLPYGCFLRSSNAYMPGFSNTCSRATCPPVLSARIHAYSKAAPHFFAIISNHQKNPSPFR